MAARPPFRTTSFDVAARAGVAQSTVSRALRDDPTIPEPTRQRIRTIAGELGYRVDANAARLRAGQTRTLALVVLCRAGEDRSAINPFYFSLLGSVAAAAADRGFDLMVSFQDSSAALTVDYQHRRQADGLIVIGSARHTEAWEQLRAGEADGLALACWGAPDDGLRRVRGDNRTGARLAVDHLVDIGARRIAYLCPPDTSVQFRMRHTGYLDAMAAHGLDPIVIPSGTVAGRDEQGYAAASALIASGEPIDGVFAASDLIALGALRRLAEAGVGVPHDMAVIGFDGIPAAAYASPTLSSIEQDFSLAGKLLVDQVLDAIAGGPREARTLPVRLIARRSTTRDP